MVGNVPLRSSSLRSLGAWGNIFAIESFIDELAQLKSADPVEYRLAILPDERARRVVETAAKVSEWFKKRADGAALGIGFARYNAKAAYCAVVAQVEVDEDVSLKSIWCCTDAGLIVNPDGAKSQLEGGIVQGASFTLREEVRFDDGRIVTDGFEKYPILRFIDIPKIEICLIAAPNEAALGVGECSVGPASAAIANAVASALGQRIRELPLTREKIMSTLLASA
jgi:CO/xanthine dehydrogenase Mo-binding subunit